MNVYVRNEHGRKIYYTNILEAGRIRRRSTGTSSQREAVKRAYAMQQAADSAGRVEASGCSISLDDVWHRYEAWAQTVKREKTIKGERHTWNKFSAWSRRSDAAKIDAPFAEEYKRHLLRTLSPTSVNTHLRTLSNIWAACTSKVRNSDGSPLIPVANPWSAEHVERPPAERKRVYALTRTQLNTLFEESPNISVDLQAFVALGALAGLRHKEILAARWHWVDFDATNEAGERQGTLYVRKGHKFEPKTYHGTRKIPLHPGLLLSLHALRERCTPSDGDFIVWPRAEYGVSEYRFDVRKQWTRLREVTGLKYLDPFEPKSSAVTPHLLRHTFASLHAQAGTPLWVIKEWMGHSDIAVTQMYAHMCPKDSRIGAI